MGDSLLNSGSFITGNICLEGNKSAQKKKKDLKLEAEQLKTRMNDNKQDEIIELGRSNDPDFLNRFKEVYPGFIDKLLTINSGLENSELVFVPC